MSIKVEELGIASIKTTIAINQKQVDEGIQSLMSNSKNHKRLIGLDTIPMTTGNAAGRKGSLVVLQLCDERQCLIVRLVSFNYGLPQSLYNFLTLPSFTFVGFGIKDAMASLREEYGLLFKNALEAGHYGSPSSPDPSVNYVLRSMNIPPTHCISDSWHPGDKLTEDLIKLAVSNAHAAFHIGDIIIDYP